MGDTESTTSGSTTRQAVSLVITAAGTLALANAALVALPSGWDVAAAAAASVAVLVLGRALNLTWQQMGLGSDRVRTGLAWGAVAIAVTAAVYGLLLAIPPAREVTTDLAAPSGSNVWVTATIFVLVRTVVLEELTFRGVLWGLLERTSGSRWALFGTSLAFGLWHVVPALAVADRAGSAAWTSILGVIAFTTAAGLLFGELRRRSGSVIAPAAFHWATNGLGLLAVYAA